MASVRHRIRKVARPVLMAGGAALTVSLLTAVLVVLPVGLGPLGAGTAHAATPSELNQKLENNRVELQNLREKLAKSEAERKAAEGDIAALDQNIDGLEKEVRVATAAYDAAAEKLVALKERLEKLTKDLKKKQAELKRAEEDLAIQQDIFDKRLINIYKSGGDLGYITALMESNSLSEMVTRADAFTAIMDQDSDLLNQIKDLKDQVTTQKQALEREQAEVASLEKQQRVVTADLEEKAEKKQAALAELEKARKAKQQVVDNAEKNETLWKKQADDLLAESDRVTELLRKSAAGSSSGGSSSGGSSSGGSDTSAVSPQMNSGRLYRPVPGIISSPYGYRIHPISRVRKLHTGADMRAGMGTPIHAAESGTVIFAGWRGGYGKCIIIDHGGGLATLYGHESEILVGNGQKVSRGQIIGKVGSTGYSTGPHLHFEVRVNGSPVNPAGYL